MVAAIPTLAKVVVGRRYPEPRKEAGPEDIDNRDLHVQMILVFHALPSFVVPSF